MIKLIILLALVNSCGQWPVPQEEQDIRNYRYDVPSEEKENAD